MDITILGIDLAKATFQVHGADLRGKCVARRTLRRSQVTDFVANLKPCTVVMEACGSAHFWARKFQSFGHTVRLIAPHYVKPFVKTNKSDAADAEAIVEAASRAHSRFVPIKTARHSDLQAIHRVRARLIRCRTALANEMRGILYEHGVILNKEIRTIKAAVPDLLNGKIESELTPDCQQTVAELFSELTALEARIFATEKRIERIAKDDDRCKRLMTVPGIGIITAAAMIAAVPDPNAFKNGRHFAASLGLVPKHTGTGGKNRVGAISKRGDRYIRSLLVHGARAAIRVADKRTDRQGAWLVRLKTERGYNKASVALANKNARIILKLLKGETRFESEKASGY